MSILDPKNDNGTCIVSMWFKLLLDDVAYAINKKFQLYSDEFYVDEV